MSQLDPDQLADAGQDPENPNVSAVPLQQQAIGDILSQLLKATQQGQAPGQSAGVTLGVPQGAAPNSGMDAAKQRVTRASDKLAAVSVDPAGTAQRAREEKQAISNSYRAAVQKPLDEVHAITEERLKPMQAEAEAADKEYQNAVKSRQEYRTKVDNVINSMDTLGKRIAAEQPRDIWAEAGLGTKIAGIALMGLGGAAQALYGDRTNSIADAIDGAIKRDLALQRMRLEKNKDDYGNKNLLLGQLRANVDRTEHAEDAAHATAWQGILGRLSVVKSMLTDPTMRANAEKVIAEGQMKAADSTQKLMANLVGTDVRMKQAEGHLEVEAAKLNAQSGQGSAMLNAQTRAAAEQRMAGKDSREQTSLEIPNWEFPAGFKGAPKEATALRDMEADTFKATQSMDQVRELLKQGGQYSSYPKWADIAAVSNRAIVKLKGKGIVNAGANFTKLEEDLIQKGYLSTTGQWLRNLDPNAGARIQAAEADLWDDVEHAMAERGGRPAKSHPVFGGE